MGAVKKPYGPHSRAMLESLRKKDLLKAEALVAFLSSRDIRIDRSLISHWCAGRSHLPADLLPLLSEFTGRPDAVFGHYVREVGCEVVQLPEAEIGDKELVDLILDAGATLGRLQRALFEARLPTSPGGEAITREERAELRRRLDELIQCLADVRARLLSKQQD